MNFLSLAYLLFLPAVFAVHWAVPARLRWATVLAASLWFVAAAAPSALVPLLLATALAWAAGLALARRPGERRTKALFALAVAAPLAALAVFKYAGFASELAASAARACGLALHPATARLALPLGISFWTFTLVSYLLDVRRGTIPAERHPGRFAAYVLLFPKLAAGPIERAGRLLPQLAAPEPFSCERASRGMRQIALGVFRKAVVADYLATFTDAAFASPGRFNSSALLLAAILYSLQIYNDFAGYSDIAIGSARLLGLELADNFRAMRDACAARGVRFRLAFPPVREDNRPSAAYLARIAEQVRDICPEIDGLVRNLRVEPPEHFRDSVHYSKKWLDENRESLRSAILAGNGGESP